MTAIRPTGMLAARGNTPVGSRAWRLHRGMKGDQAGKIMLVYCTCPDEQAGAELATYLVEHGFAGCVNVLPGITSIYKWRGEMKSGTEALLLIKCPEGNYPLLETTIKNRHPYELAEIIAVSIDAGLPAYLDWIRDEAKLESNV